MKDVKDAAARARHRLREPVAADLCGFVLCSDYHVVERRAEVRQIAISRELNCTFGSKAHHKRSGGTAAGITSSSPPAPLAAPLAT